MISHEPASRRPADMARHYLGDLVYGANDGLVTTFTVVSGVAGAQLAPAVVLIIGFVNLIADGFSMGASNYLAIRSAALVDGRERGVREPLLHGLATFASFVLLGVVPLVAYLAGAFPVSLVATGAALFGVGAARALVIPLRRLREHDVAGKATGDDSRRAWWRTGLEMLVVGAVAAAVAYGVGALLARLTGSAR